MSASAAEEKVSVGDLSGRWTGEGSSNRVGDIVVNAGDINSDGYDDFVTMVDGTANRGVWVFFGPGMPSSPLLSDLSPDDGYRIASVSDAQWPSVVGDQNSDGIPDIVVAEGSSGNDATVVYGVADPATDLAQCAPPAQTRCVSTTDPVDANGNRLGFKIHGTSSMTETGARWASGDFDGDGKDELLAPSTADQAVVMTNGLGEGCPAAPGLCTIDLSTLSAPDVVYIDSPAPGASFGQYVSSPGDVNNDGRDDLVVPSGTDGSIQPGVWVVYGKEFTQSTESVTDAVADGGGFKVDLPFSTYGALPFETGDVNGDGIADIGMQMLEIIPAQATYFTVIFGSEDVPEANLSADPPTLGTGVQYEWDSGFTPYPFGTLQGAYPVGLGDLNGDGAGEIGVGISNAAVDGNNNAGRIVILSGGSFETDNVVPVSSSVPASDALVLGGDTTSLRLGTGLAPAGDIDDDGVNDIAVGASGFALTTPAANNAGILGLLSSAKYYPQGRTGVAGKITKDGADLSGTVNPNRRASSAYFEYGATPAYGSQTVAESVGKSANGKSFETEVSGLSPDTEYHYRVVVENDLGIKAYGDDRTFQTAGLDRCEVDPTQAGCNDYDHCKSNPTDPICQPDPQAARLSQLILGQKTVRIKRLKRGAVKVTVVNTGNASAAGVKLCASGPKRFVAVQKCKRIGGLAAGKVATRAFKVKVKRNARKGKRIVLKLRATANGLGARTARVKVRVR